MQNKTIDTVELKIALPEIEAFIVAMRNAGLIEATLKNYRHAVLVLYEFLPENKLLRKETLEQWYLSMKEEGYTLRTMNSRLSAVNTFLDYMGRRELQFLSFEKASRVETELTRAEYLRLLSIAKALNKERGYLMVKLFGTTGIPVQRLPEVTVEAVSAGWIGDTQKKIRFSRGLQQELLEYSKRQGIISGPLFKTQTGQPLDRTYVSYSIRVLGEAANIEPDKATPRHLQKLYQKTRANIEQEIAQLIEERYNNLLDTEQIVHGWK